MYNGLVKRFGKGGVADVMLVSPQVYELRDGPRDTELYWDADGGSHGERNWKWGGNSTADLDASLSSFEVLDEVLQTLADATAYPRLKRIVVAGHSAGGANSLPATEAIEKSALAAAGALRPSTRAVATAPRCESPLPPSVEHAVSAAVKRKAPAHAGMHDLKHMKNRSMIKIGG